MMITLIAKIAMIVMILTIVMIVLVLIHDHDADYNDDVDDHNAHCDY